MRVKFLNRITDFHKMWYKHRVTAFSPPSLFSASYSNNTVQHAQASEGVATLAKLT